MEKGSSRLISSCTEFYYKTRRDIIKHKMMVKPRVFNNNMLKHPGFHYKCLIFKHTIQAKTSYLIVQITLSWSTSWDFFGNISNSPTLIDCWNTALHKKYYHSKILCFRKNWNFWLYTSTERSYHWMRYLSKRRNLPITNHWNQNKCTWWRGGPYFINAWHECPFDRPQSRSAIPT